MLPGPLKQVGEAGRQEWGYCLGHRHRGAMEPTKYWGGLATCEREEHFFLQEIHFFSDTQGHRAGMRAQKWFMTCRGGALYLIRDRGAPAKSLGAGVQSLAQYFFSL